MDDDSRGFVSAFTRAVRHDAEPGQAARRMFMVSFAGVLAVALAALLLGAFGNHGSTTNTSAAGGLVGSAYGAQVPGFTAPPGTATVPTAPATSTTAAPSSWSAVAGPDCGNPGALFAAAADSVSNATGGDTGDGCHGKYLSVPVSGNATKYDLNRLTLWTFAFASRYTSCQLSTYVPNSTDITKAGGDPAYYYVYGTMYTTGSLSTPGSKAQPQLSYAVSQVSSHGQWITGHTFTVTSGAVTVAMLDAGLGSGSAAQARRVAAAEVRLTCHQG